MQTLHCHFLATDQSKSKRGGISAGEETDPVRQRQPQLLNFLMILFFLSKLIPIPKSGSIIFSLTFL